MSSQTWGRQCGGRGPGPWARARPGPGPLWPSSVAMYWPCLDLSQKHIFRKSMEFRWVGGLRRLLSKKYQTVGVASDYKRAPAPKKRKVMTKSILYKTYGQHIFQKVALGYFLHFVQNGSSQNIWNTYVCTTIRKQHGKHSDGKQSGSLIPICIYICLCN